MNTSVQTPAQTPVLAPTDYLEDPTTLQIIPLYGVPISIGAWISEATCYAYDSIDATMVAHTARMIARRFIRQHSIRVTRNGIEVPKD
jgi:hypothetical protein